jgi:succinate-semialdehyde dehydrogenase/glutarate-semialdehyde dehydrogenase
VLPIVVVDSEDEAVALANDSDFGLGASVWTSDRAKGERVAGELQSGMVWINDHMFSHGRASARGEASSNQGSAARIRSSGSTSA